MITGGWSAPSVPMAFLRIERSARRLYALRIVQGVAFTCAYTSAQTLAVLFAPVERRGAGDRLVRHLDDPYARDQPGHR